MRIKVSLYIRICGALLVLIYSCQKEETPPKPVIDFEGNIYKTVRIGEQIWMAENLKTTSYNDGTAIPLVTDATIWVDLTSPGFCWYNNEEDRYKDSYGALYNGYSICTGKLCPEGWHVPALEEWQKLKDFLNDTITAGGKMKEAGTTHWLTPNKGADNISGFNALPAGIRYLEGTFSSILYTTCIWSATEVGTNDEWFLSLYYGDAYIKIINRSKNHGFSVRCIKD